MLRPGNISGHCTAMTRSLKILRLNLGGCRGKNIVVLFDGLMVWAREYVVVVDDDDIF